MTNKKTLYIVIAAAILLVIGIGGITISYSNSVNNKEANVDASFSQLQAQYQRRADLIAQTIPVVKEASRAEGETLERVVQARYTGTDVNQVQASEAQLALQFKQVTEAYPELQSQARFADLQVQIEGNENRILRAREVYVDTATEFNKTIRNFPGSLLGKEPRELFNATPDAQDAPVIDFE